MPAKRHLYAIKGGLETNPGKRSLPGTDPDRVDLNSLFLDPEIVRSDADQASLIAARNMADKDPDVVEALARMPAAMRIGDSILPVLTYVPDKSELEIPEPPTPIA